MFISMYTIITPALITRNYAESVRLPAKDASIKAAVKVKISSVKTFDNTFNMPEYHPCNSCYCRCDCSDDCYFCDACSCDGC